MLICCSEWKLAVGFSSGNLKSRSVTPALPEEPRPEPMDEDPSSVQHDALTNTTSRGQQTGDAGEIQVLSQGLEVQRMGPSRSQMTPSPILTGGGAARSPAASSTHSSVCSIEESSPGLGAALHFLREAHNYLGGYVYSL